MLKKPVHCVKCSKILGYRYPLGRVLYKTTPEQITQRMDKNGKVELVCYSCYMIEIAEQLSNLTPFVIDRGENYGI